MYLLRTIHRDTICVGENTLQNIVIIIKHNIRRAHQSNGWERKIREVNGNIGTAFTINRRSCEDEVLSIEILSRTSSMSLALYLVLYFRL